MNHIYMVEKMEKGEDFFLPHLAFRHHEDALQYIDDCQASEENAETNYTVTTLDFIGGYNV